MITLYYTAPSSFSHKQIQCDAVTTHRGHYIARVRGEPIKVIHGFLLNGYRNEYIIPHIQDGPFIFVKTIKQHEHIPEFRHIYAELCAAQCPDHSQVITTKYDENIDYTEFINDFFQGTHNSDYNADSNMFYNKHCSEHNSNNHSDTQDEHCSEHNSDNHISGDHVSSTTEHKCFHCCTQ